MIKSILNDFYELVEDHLSRLDILQQHKYEVGYDNNYWTIYIKYINKRSKAVDNNLIKRIKKLYQWVSDKQSDHHMLVVRVISSQDDK